MKNKPNRIYLQIDNEGGDDDDFNELSEVCWCANKVFEDDIAYTLSEQADSDAIEFHEWVGKQGYKLSHYAAKGEAIHLHESAGSAPFYELKEGQWLTTKELYQRFKTEVEKGMKENKSS